MRTSKSVVSDHLKNSLNIKKIRVGENILKIKALPLQAENEIITNFSDGGFPISEFYEIAISLYDEREVDVVEAYSKVLPRHNSEDRPSYDFRLKKHISSKTFDFICFETHYYLIPHIDILKKNIQDTIRFIDSSFYKPIKDVLFFLVNNYGYKYTDISKLPSEDVFNIALNESIIRSDVLTFSLLLKTFHYDLNEDEDSNELLINLIEVFVENSTLFEVNDLKKRLYKVFNDLKIEIPIPDLSVQPPSDGKAKIKDENAINSLDAFKKIVDGIKNQEDAQN